MRIKKSTLVIVITVIIGILITAYVYDAERNKIPDPTYRAATERFQNASPAETYRIIVDKKTGVNYIVYEAGFGRSARVGITPLIGSDANPVVTPVTKNEKEDKQ